MSSDPRQPPTLETLLQLKRAERPAPEFWEKFDRELRQKQLAALVKEPRWWQRLDLGLPRWVYAPAGAAAALALSLASVRMMMPVAEAPLAPVQRAAVVKAPPVDQIPATAQPTTVEAIPAAVTEDPVAVAVQESTPVSAPGDAVAAGLTSRLVAGMTDEERPSARTIAANLAQLEQTDPDLVRSMQSVRISDARSVRTQVEVQPVAALASWTAGSSRISRLAVADIAYNRQFTPEPAAPEVLRERMARRLGDADLGSRGGRLGLEGDRLHVRF